MAMSERGGGVAKVSLEFNYRLPDLCLLFAPRVMLYGRSFATSPAALEAYGELVLCAQA